MDGQVHNVGRAERVFSAVGGGLLAYYGLRRRNWTASLPLLVTGGALVTRAATGHSQVYDRLDINTARVVPVDFHTTITVNKPPEEVYRFWRQLKNLPRFMRHLRSVSELDSRHSHWVAETPMGMTMEWDAEIVDDQPNKRLRWRSTAGSNMDHDGEVVFAPAPGGRGTEVHVQLRYKPATGMRSAMAKLSHKLTEQFLKEDVRRFKAVLETGEAPTIAGQSSARAR
jgi:uncharacterized membrane protein